MQLDKIGNPMINDNIKTIQKDGGKNMKSKKEKIYILM